MDDLCKLQDIARDLGIDEDLKDIADDLGTSVRAGLLHKYLAGSTVEGLLGTKSEGQVLDAVLNEVTKEVKNGRIPTAHVDCLATLFWWIVTRPAHLMRLEGLPVPTADADDTDCAVLTLRRGTDHSLRPLGPIPCWPETSRRFAGLFPKKRILHSLLASGDGREEYWRQLESQHQVFLSPLCEFSGQLKDAQLLREFEGDAHAAIQPLSLSNIVALEDRDTGLIDTARKARSRAILLVEFILGWVTYTCHFSNPQTWSNADVTLFSDTARNGAVAFGSSPRCGTFAGTIYYAPVEPTETGACCFPDGTCQTMHPTPCVGQGGAYGGANSSCAPAQCPQPAACCFGNGTCAMLLPSPCLEQGGIFYAGLNCLATPCPAPATGGCCLPNSTCTVTWMGECTSQGGIYGGNNTTCDDPNCGHVVVPNANEAAEGDNETYVPFADVIFSYARYQQVYGSEAFASVHGPQRIRAIQFRPNRSSSPVQWHSSFNLDLRLSTSTTAAPDWISYNFANNIGADETVVYQGPAVISTAQAGSATGPMKFDLVINLQTPFVYDPAEGNLLIDATVDGILAGDIRWLDEVRPEGDAVSRVTSPTRGAVNGTPSTFGLVTRFLLERATEGCYANCDGSTTAPVLNVLDFNCFLNHFTAGDPYANCDGSTVAPVLNVLDFNCFLNRFTAGCP